MDALDEGDEVVVSFEDGSSAVLSSEVTMDWIGSGDMGATMNESLTLSVAFIRKSTGKYEVHSLPITIMPKRTSYHCLHQTSFYIISIFITEKIRNS